MTHRPKARDDYFIGTEDAEVERLYRQHVVWRSRATDAWRRAGFAAGDHILDIGCGPGHATMDLAAVVGPAGRVTALDRSARFLEALSRRARAMHVDNVVPTVVDLDEPSLPDVTADGAWCRWVFCFLRHPRSLLERVGDRLSHGGTLVVHEYFDYGAWRLAPRSAGLDRFVETVMRQWSADGGEPDIALDLLTWLPEAGFEIREIRPLVDVVTPDDPVWEWPHGFVDAGVRRLVTLGALSKEEADGISRDYRASIEVPNVRMVTPAVLEIIADRR